MPTQCTYAVCMLCTCYAHTMPHATCHMPCLAISMFHVHMSMSMSMSVSMSVSMFVSMFRALHGMCRAPWLVAARHSDHKRRAADVVHLRREGEHLLHIPLHVSSPVHPICIHHMHLPPVLYTRIS